MRRAVYVGRLVRGFSSVLGSLVALSSLLGCGDEPLVARRSSMPCEPGLYEVWRVEDRGPGEVFVEVNVVGAAYTPTVTVHEVARRPRNAQEVVGGAALIQTSWSPDQGFPCAGGDVDCPRGEVRLDDDAFAIVVGVDGACSGPDADYALKVGIDGRNADVMSLGVARGAP